MYFRVCVCVRAGGGAAPAGLGRRLGSLAAGKALDALIVDLSGAGDPVPGCPPVAGEKPQPMSPDPSPRPPSHTPSACQKGSVPRLRWGRRTQSELLCCTYGG